MEKKKLIILFLLLSLFFTIGCCSKVKNTNAGNAKKKSQISKIGKAKSNKTVKVKNKTDDLSVSSDNSRAVVNKSNDIGKPQSKNEVNKILKEIKTHMALIKKLDAKSNKNKKQESKKR